MAVAFFLLTFAVASATPARAQTAPLACRAPTEGVRWDSLAPADQRDVLDRWCESVGPPLLIAAPSSSEPVATLVIATWNVHVGNGDVDQFLATIARDPAIGRPYGVVLLLQEAVRVGADVPARYPVGMRPPRALRSHLPAQDIAASAARLSMHLAYVPSMRNGRDGGNDAPQDRGNAILSTQLLGDVRAIELPFGKQRHVGVAATIAAPGFPSLRLVTIHLDPSGHRADEATALATYLPQLAVGGPLVVGGDLNTWFGRDERAFTVLSSALPVAECGRGKTNTWPWRLHVPLGWWRGRLDYIFTAPTAGLGGRCETVSHQFGSDHRPVVMLIRSPA